MKGKPDFKNIKLGEIRGAGVHELFVSCPACGHNRSLELAAFSRFADGDALEAIGRAMKCLKCRRRGSHGVYPESRPWVWYLRRTGQDHRLPYWAPMVPHEGEVEVG